MLFHVGRLASTGQVLGVSRMLSRYRNVVPPAGCVWSSCTRWHNHVRERERDGVSGNHHAKCDLDVLSDVHSFTDGASSANTYPDAYRLHGWDCHARRSLSTNWLEFQSTLSPCFGGMPERDTSAERWL
jgi:hypothetical protein